MMSSRYLLMMVISCFFLFPLAAREKNSEKRTLVLFNFSPGKTKVPAEKLSDVLAGMKAFLEGQGVYEVTLWPTALDSPGAGVLFENLKGPPGVARPAEALVIGDISIAPADIETLSRAAAWIVTSLAEYASEEDKRPGGSRWKVRLKTVFDFFIREGELVRQTRTVETMGYDPAEERALADAIKTILPQFTYEAGVVLAGERQASILAMGDGEAYIDAGEKDGVVLGSEFVVKGIPAGAENKTTVREKALLAVTEVTADVSVGAVVYADGGLAEGDAVEEVLRLGLELSPYALVFISMDPAEPVAGYAGLRVTLAKFVYTLRPFLAVETLVYPFSTYEYYFPLRPFIGAEIRVRLGRLELAALPMIGVEEWFALAPGSSSTFIGFGLRGLVQVGLLVSRDVKIFIEGGYEYWFGTREGFLAGGGISIKL